jgi:hypothetical protein
MDSTPPPRASQITETIRSGRYWRAAFTAAAWPDVPRSCIVDLMRSSSNLGGVEADGMEVELCRESPFGNSALEGYLGLRDACARVDRLQSCGGTGPAEWAS